VRLLRRLLPISTRPGGGSEGGLTNSEESTRRLVSKGPAPSLPTEEIATHNAAGRYAASLAIVADALERTRNEPELLLARASTLFAWGRLREARNEFLRAQGRVDDRGTEGHFGLGIVLKAQRRMVEAVGSYERALELYPDFVDCLIHYLPAGLPKMICAVPKRCCAAPLQRTASGQIRRTTWE
jgi:tetratricopeptide (TPR) repeat protein